MKQIPAIMGWLLVIFALGLYVFGLGDAIYLSFKDHPGMPTEALPAPLDMMIASLGAILLTNLGAVLGISVTNKNSALASFTVPFMAARAVTAPMNTREQLQYTGVIVYLAGLIACFVAWAVKDFSTDPLKLVDLLPQQGKTLIGVFTAYLAFVLGVNQQ